MNLLIVSVRDGASAAFGRPFFVVARGQAIRSFQDEVNRQDNNNDLHKHPEDFDLYCVGIFDDNTGQIVGQPPELLIRGKDAVHASQ